MPQSIDACTTTMDAECRGSFGLRARLKRTCHSMSTPAALAASSVRWRIQFKLCCMMHAICYRNSPVYLANIVHPTNAGRFRRRLRSASSSDYTVPRLRTKFGKRAFSHAGPAAWNTLPEDICSNHDCVVFRKQLKTHFFSLAFNVR